MSSATAYAPLDTSSNEIRLLTILPATSAASQVRCQLKHVSFLSKPSFEALSYTWGRIEPQSFIVLNGQPFPVRENLNAALRRLRRSFKSRIIWIDALCINQTDLDERREQVKVMDKIYQQAERVVVWLGEPAAGGTSALDSIESVLGSNLTSGFKIWKQNRMYGPLFHRDFGSSIGWQATSSLVSEQERGEVGQLLDRPWWRRVWIIQEAVLAQNLTLMCGSEDASWESVERYTKRQLWQTGLQGAGIRVESVYPYPTQIYGRINALRRDRVSSQRSSIYRLLYEFRNLECTDPRDRIFAFLGISTDAARAHISPDYVSSPHQVYINFARSVIYGHGVLDVLNCCRNIHMDKQTSQKQRVYSLVDQSRYYDTNAPISDGPEHPPRRGWIRLPKGWERRCDNGEVTFFDHSSQSSYKVSPLAGRAPSQPLPVATQRALPDNWNKNWDNLGRVILQYSPDSEPEIQSTRNPAPSLPSWAPNWGMHSNRDPLPLPGWTSNTPRYWASGMNTTVSSFHASDPNVLCVGGVLFDEIEVLTLPWFVDLETPQISRKRHDVLESWEALSIISPPECPYEQSGGRGNALWRTFIADDAGDNAAPQADEAYYEVWCDRVNWTPPTPPTVTRVMGLWETAQASSDHDHFPDLFGHFLEVSKHYENMDFTRWSTVGRVVVDSLQYQKVVKEKYKMYSERIHHACANRALFVSRRGYIGLAPWNAQGDRIAILSGGQTPYVLRRQSTHPEMHTLVGEAYVYGLMGGEALVGKSIFETPGFQAIHIS